MIRLKRFQGASRVQLVHMQLKQIVALIPFPYFGQTFDQLADFLPTSWIRDRLQKGFLGIRKF